MDKKDLRIVFMGTPEFAVPTLQRLIDGGYNVVGVVTQPDRPVGRHQDTLQPSAVKQCAVAHNLPVLQPEKMKDPGFVAQLQALRPDLQVVVAFRMLPEVVWAMPRFGTFNVHAALLPQYRGAAPINWAVINGETKTGVTTFFLDKNIDTGRIIVQKEFDIPHDADVEYVYDGLMKLGADIAIETVDKVIEGDGKVESHVQPEAAQLKPAPKIFKDTCRINWNQPAAKIYNFVRGLSPYPGAWTLFGQKAQVLKIYRTVETDLPTDGAPGEATISGKHLYFNTADHLLEVLSLQLAGKKRMDAKSFINGIKQ